MKKNIIVTTLSCFICFLSIVGGFSQSTIKIMPLGNSITQGQAEEDRTSYRRYLWVKLQDAGYTNVEFIGTMDNPWGNDLDEFYSDYDKRHEGHASWQSIHILNGWTNPPNLNNYNPDYNFDFDGQTYKGGKLSLWLEDYLPDIVLMHLGTNDAFYSGTDDLDIFISDKLPIIQQNFKDIIGVLREFNPEVEILLAKIIPTSAGTGFNWREDFIVELNENIPIWAEEMDTPYSRVILVDHTVGFNPRRNDDTYDGIHTNESGSIKMADNWFEKLELVFNENIPEYTGVRFGAKYLGEATIFKYDNFDLNIKNAHNVSVKLEGDHSVTITTNNPNDGTIVFNDLANFSEGIADITISLPDRGKHILTVTIDGIDNDELAQIDVFESYVWEGTTSINWETGANWGESITPPDDFVSITINSGANQPVLSTPITVKDLNIAENAILTLENGGSIDVRQDGSLTIENNAELIVKPGATITSLGQLTNNAGSGGLLIESDVNGSGSVIINNDGVNATVQRYLQGRTWHIISPPVEGQSLEDFFADNPISENNSDQVYAIQDLDEASNSWSAFFPMNTTGLMEVGKAYNVRISPADGGVIVFKGDLISETTTREISRNSSGWNAIGNPFSSSMGVTFASEVNGFLQSNALELDPGYAGLYIFDTADQQYKIINNVPQDGLLQDYISLGQGFVIRSKEDGGNVVFNNRMRKHDNAIFYKNIMDSEWFFFQIDAVRWDDENQSVTRNTRIAFNNKMSMDMDITFDTGIYSESSVFSIYTRLPENDNNLNLGVQALPARKYHEFTIPLGLRNQNGGEVELSISNSNLPEYLTPVLVDSLYSSVINLNEGNYLVDLPAAFDSHSRFYIRMEDSRPHHIVEYEVVEGHGIIKAFCAGDSLHNGDVVPIGESVSFSIVPHEHYTLDYWMINGEALDYPYDYLVISEVNEPMLVQVALKSTLSDDSSLKEIIINDDLLPDFEPSLYSYSVELAHWTTEIPMVFAEPNHPGALIDIEQAANLLGSTSDRTAIIKVSAENNIEESFYSVEFSLKEIQVFPVYFDVLNPHGAITAIVEDENIWSGEYVEKGKNIHFSAYPNSHFKIESWSVNDIIQEVGNSPVFTYENLDEPIDVTVSFYELSTDTSLESIDYHPMVTLSRENIIIDIKNQNYEVILIYDALGRIMTSKDIRHASENLISITGFESGLYLVHLQGESGIYRKKIIIK